MANYILSIFLLAIIATSAAQAAEAVGSREIDLPDAAGDRVIGHGMSACGTRPPAAPLW